jgi:tctex1 domain-containing protein 2
MSSAATAAAEPHHKRRSSSAAAPAAATAARSDDGGSDDSDANLKAPSQHESLATTTNNTNTYLIGPRAHAEAAGSPAAARALGAAPFDAAAARRALRAAILERVAGSASAYDPLAAAQMARRLAEDARQRLRALGYGRYKLVVQAAVGERAGQAVRCASRCLWGEGDGWASESYESDALYCVVQVHALYHE